MYLEKIVREMLMKYLVNLQLSSSVDEIHEFVVLLEVYKKRVGIYSVKGDPRTQLNKINYSFTFLQYLKKTAVFPILLFTFCTKKREK
jgi:hypothetical protein